MNIRLLVVLVTLSSMQWRQWWAMCAFVRALVSKQFPDVCTQLLSLGDKMILSVATTGSVCYCHTYTATYSQTLHPCTVALVLSSTTSSKLTRACVASKYKASCVQTFANFRLRFMSYDLRACNHCLNPPESACMRASVALSQRALELDPYLRVVAEKSSTL